ncbi:hypothetical protein MNEG_15934, partial [Monoraphidium neglectum]
RGRDRPPRPGRRAARQGCDVSGGGGGGGGRAAAAVSAGGRPRELGAACGCGAAQGPADRSDRL